MSRITQETFLKDTTEWVAKKYLPLNFFQDEHTKTYFSGILPDGIKLPERRALRKSMKMRFFYYKDKLKAMLQNKVSKLALTMDGWTSISGRSYYGLTVHYINEEWENVALTLDFLPCHGNHTAEDIADLLLKCLEEYGIKEKVSGITMDNASVNDKMMRVLMEREPTLFSEDNHFKCIAHILNLAAQDLMRTLNLRAFNFAAEIESDSEPDSEEDCERNDIDDHEDSGEYTLGKLKTLMVKIKNSEQFRRQLRVATEATKEKYRTPVLDCPTRWNSSLNMISCAIQMSNAINVLCNANRRLAEYAITSEEWAVLKAVETFLRPFKFLTELLSGEKYPTLPNIVVALNQLLDKIEQLITALDIDPNRSQVDETLLLAFQAARDKIIIHYRKTNWIICAVLILDPRHKLETFSLTSWGKNLKDQSLEKFKEIFENYKGLDENEVDIQDENEDDLVYGLYAKKVKHSDEMSDYLNSPRATRSVNICKWWRDHEVEYPVLANICKDLLCIPATSVPSERLFSRAGLTITKLRNRLGDESARHLLCVSDWAQTLK